MAAHSCRASLGQLHAILLKQYNAARFGDEHGFHERYEHYPRCLSGVLRPIRTPDDFVWFTKTGAERGVWSR